MAEARDKARSSGGYDEIYGDLLDAFEDLTEQDQLRLSASLLVCLCHRIADRREIMEAIAEAKRTL